MTLSDGFDLCMLLIVVFFAVKGGFRGFSEEIFSLAGVVGGVYCGFKYAAPAGAALRKVFASLSPSAGQIIAAAVLFFAACAACAVAGKLFRALLSWVSLSALDRLCGFVVGVVKGVVVVAFAVMLLQQAGRFVPAIDLKGSRAALLVNAVLPDIRDRAGAFFPKNIV